MGGMGYAAEYHVERYLRECFVPRLAPVSRVSLKIIDSNTTLDLSTNFDLIGNDHELHRRESSWTAKKLLILVEELLIATTTAAFNDPCASSNVIGSFWASHQAIIAIGT